MCGEGYQFHMPTLTRWGRNLNPEKYEASTFKIRGLYYTDEGEPPYLTHREFNDCIKEGKDDHGPTGIDQTQINQLNSMKDCGDHFGNVQRYTCWTLANEEQGYVDNSRYLIENAGQVFMFHDTELVTLDAQIAECDMRDIDEEKDMCYRKASNIVEVKKAARGNFDYFNDRWNMPPGIIQGNTILASQSYLDCTYFGQDPLGGVTDFLGWSGDGHRVCEQADAPDFGCVPYIDAIGKKGDRIVADLKLVKTYSADPFHPCGQSDYPDDGEYSWENAGIHSLCLDCSSYEYQHQMTPKQAVKFYSVGFENGTELCTSDDFNRLMQFYEQSFIGPPDASAFYGFMVGDEKIEFGWLEHAWDYASGDADDEITFTLEVRNKRSKVQCGDDESLTITGGQSGYGVYYEVDNVDDVDSISAYMRSGQRDQFIELHKVSPNGDNFTKFTPDVSGCDNEDYPANMLKKATDKLLASFNQLTYGFVDFPPYCLAHSPTHSNKAFDTDNTYGPSDNDAFFTSETIESTFECRPVISVAPPNSTSWALIIGLSVGGVLLLITVFLLVWYFLRREKNKKLLVGENNEDLTGATTIVQAAGDESLDYYGYDDYDYEGYYDEMMSEEYDDLGDDQDDEYYDEPEFYEEENYF